jgi:hypothetical protein
VPFEIASIDEAEIEFLALPTEVRESFIAAFRELAASGSPMVSARGWHIEELRQRQRVAPEGLYSLHVGELWRGVFYRRGDSLTFIGFGFRLPEFYDKLKRLRAALAEERPRGAGRN